MTINQLDQERQFVSPGIKKILDGIKQGTKIDQDLLDLLEDGYQFLTNLGLIVHFKDVIFGNISQETKMTVLRKLYSEYMADTNGDKKTTILELFLIVAKAAAGKGHDVEIKRILEALSADNREHEETVAKIREAIKKVYPKFKAPPPPMS